MCAKREREKKKSNRWTTEGKRKKKGARRSLLSSFGPAQRRALNALASPSEMRMRAIAPSRMCNEPFPSTERRAQLQQRKKSETEKPFRGRDERFDENDECSQTKKTRFVLLPSFSLPSQRALRTFPLFTGGNAAERASCLCLDRARARFQALSRSSLEDVVCLGFASERNCKIGDRDKKCLRPR